MSSSSPPTHSIIEYFFPPEEDGHRCGYCKSPNTNHSHGLWAHSLSPSNYESLLNLGWRRSGSYVYKPMNDKICCPMYTIRNLSTAVEISRAQRKVLKRFRAYLKDGKGGEKQEQLECMNVGRVFNNRESLTDGPTNNHHGDTTSQPTTPKKPHPLKKKPLRRERKRLKLLSKGLDPIAFFTQNARNRVLELEQFFTSGEDSDKFQFSTKLVRVDGPDFEEKYFKMEHALYERYQMSTHGDEKHDCRESQFKRFLCDNPFGLEGDGDQTPLLGTYHQHYYINSSSPSQQQLFAVGVIDILPTSISSVYFFYDPAYSFLSPGTLGALHEIQLVNQLRKTNGLMEYYYLGFYIHSCVKMRYKAKFRPAQLVCPVSGEWVGFDGRVGGLLDGASGGFVRLKEGGGGFGEQDDRAVEKVLILHNRRVYKYKDFVPIILKQQSDVKRPKKDLQEMLKSYASLVGPEVASNMLIYVSAS